MKRSSLAAIAALTAAGALALAGCTTDTQASGSSSGGPGISIGSATIHPTAKNKKLAAIFVSPPSFGYGISEQKGVEQAAKKYGYSVDVFWDELDPAKELSNFQHVMSSGQYDGLIIEPINTQLCNQLTAQATQANMPIVTVSKGVCDDGSGTGKELWAKGTVAFVGGTSTRPGTDELLEKAAGTLKGSQNVAFVLGPQGHPSGAVAWQAAWKEFAPKHPDWKLVETAYTDFTTPDAFTKTQNLLTARPDISVIFTPYIDVTQGVAKAVEARNLKGKVAVYEETGGTAASVQLIKDGLLTGSLPAYPAAMTAKAFEVITQAIDGKQPERFYGDDGNPSAAKLGILTKDNIGQYTPQ